MRKSVLKWFKYSALVGCLAVGPYAMAAGPITLKAVSGFPTQTDYTKQFQQFINEVNKDPNVGVKIDFVGGPEAIPTYNQGKALQTGVISMIYGSVSYYFGIAPEGNALLGSKIDAAEARKNGGMEVLNKMYQKRMNGYFLGWFAPTKNFFHIYTEKEPVFDSEGKLKNKVSIRSNEQYRDLLNGMGFDPQNIGVPDVYTGLQRGAVAGVTWPLVGINDLGWVDYLHYMIEPGFYTNTIGVMVNLDDWKKLPKETQDKLQAKAIAFEQQSKTEFEALEKKTKDGLVAKGMKIITLKGAALKRLQGLEDSPWKALEKSDKAEAAVLKKYFAP
jgi:TRAP-type C4-dicarboxylate transport system substrate-binding protein